MGRRQDGERAPAARPGAGEGGAGGGRVRAVPGAGGAGDRGERGDLPGQAAGPAGQRPRSAGGGKGGLCEALAADAAAEVGRLAAAVAGSLAAGAGLEAVELAIRTAVTRLGGGMLERLLAADSGYRAPGTDCGTGHQAEFVSYRDKTVGTVLGTVTVSRAWYHCGQCGHGLAPRDAELGTAGQTMSHDRVADELQALLPLLDLPHGAAPRSRAGAQAAQRLSPGRRGTPGQSGRVPGTSAGRRS